MFVGKSLTLFCCAAALLWSRHGQAETAMKSLSFEASFTKSTKDFQVKNLFPVEMPAGMSGRLNIRGVRGQVSTTTLPDVRRKGYVGSETLFGLNAPRVGKCPKSGEATASYGDMVRSYRSFAVGSVIVKQARPGTETYHINYTLPVGVPVDIPTGGCLFVTFDGTDFADQPYTIKGNFSILYDTDPRADRKIEIPGLDAEFTLSPGNRRHPTLNAYSVLPVSESGPVQPGKILSVFGDFSVTTVVNAKDIPPSTGDWSVWHAVAVYRKDSCQKAFPDHAAHKFFWNDRTGTATVANPSSLFWPTSQIIADGVASGHGIQSVEHAASPGVAMPVLVESGDCIVDAIIPSGDVESEHLALNTESQIYLEFEPDSPRDRPHAISR